MAVGKSVEDCEVVTRNSGGRYRNLGRGAADHQRAESAVMWRVFHRIDSVLDRLAWIPSIVLVLAIIISVAQLMDRKPPFEILHVEPAFARAGEAVTLRADVWRDTERRCNATMSRYVFDANGARWDYPVSMFPASLISSMAQQTPGELKVAIVIPAGAASGQADLVSVLSYQCNRAHVLWPIEVTTHIPFTILP